MKLQVVWDTKPYALLATKVCEISLFFCRRHDIMLFGEQFLLKISNIKLWMSRCDSVSVPCVVSKISRKKNWCHIRSGGYEAARTQN